jgi:hypothetical protein
MFPLRFPVLVDHRVREKRVGVMRALISGELFGRSDCWNERSQTARQQRDRYGWWELPDIHD